MGDVTFGGDHSQVRTDSGPTNLAAGLREHAQTPLLPLVTLGSHDDFAEPLGFTPGRRR